MATPTQKPTVGRVVHVKIKDRNGNADIRPARIVKVWEPTPGNDVGCVNLSIDLDGANDAPQRQLADGSYAPPDMSRWGTSFCFVDSLDDVAPDAASWTYPPRV